MRISRIIQPFAVIVLLLIPVMFLGPNEEMTLERYLYKSCMPVVMLVIFYFNYLWLMPRQIDHRLKVNIILANIILIIAGCSIIAIVRHFEFHNFILPHQMDHGDFHRHVGHHRRHMGVLFQLFAFFRDSINLIMAVLVAYSLIMANHAHSLERQRQEAEVARRDAELKGLRQQISPHFLLNTLNNIYALTAISAERAQQAIIQLSQMLRHMLYDNQQNMIDFSAECNFICAYVDLMKLRLPSNVKVEVEIEKADDDRSEVAPLLFISLVENAFKHGVSSTEPCIISIRLAAREDEIRCEIVNSNYPKASTDRSGHGIGLQQVQQRLDSIYHNRYVWTHGVNEEDGLYHSEIVLSNCTKTIS